MRVIRRKSGIQRHPELQLGLLRVKWPSFRRQMAFRQTVADATKGSLREQF